jgi:Cu+-exporting ATPase
LLRQVDTVVFDKTGTLTVGHPRVAGVTLLQPGMSEGAMLQLAAAVERQASHPVARALVAAADAPSGGGGGGGGGGKPSGGGGGGSSSKGAHLHVEAGSFLQEPGSGAAAVVGGRRVAVGTLEWVQRQGAALKRGAAAAAAAAAGGAEAGGAVNGDGAVLAGHTQVYIGVDGAVVGMVDVADQVGAAGCGVRGVREMEVVGGVQHVPCRSCHQMRSPNPSCDPDLPCPSLQQVRPDAAATIAELRAQGLRTLMLSGDRREAALAVAAAVGIPESEVHAGVKPAGKAALVEELRGRGAVVAMVGDGINDTAALAAADVGVAMAGGVDAASDVASIVLMGDQLHQVRAAGRLPLGGASDGAARRLLGQHRASLPPCSPALKPPRLPRPPPSSPRFHRSRTPSSCRAARCPKSSRTSSGRSPTTLSASRSPPARRCPRLASR